MDMNAVGELYTCAVKDHEGAVTWTRVIADTPTDAAAEAVSNLALKGRCVVDVYTGSRTTPIDPRLTPEQTLSLIA